MSHPRKSQGHRYLPLCLLLLSACALAEARDVHMQGPNGNGGETCAEAGDATEAAMAPSAATSAAPSGKPAGAAKIKPVVTVRGGGDDSGTHAARWHSFLPGMFR